MKLDFTKTDGLIPVIIQDATTGNVLMLGYMNQVALDKTIAENRVTFFSRSKNRLWTKGETTGNFLNVVSIQEDCDNDTLLIKVNAVGPTCHTGKTSCFGELQSKGFVYTLEQTISDRIDADADESYTNQLYKKGINKVAQKLGEEAVELVIEAKDDNDELFLNEAADLLYHYLVLLKAKGKKLEEVETVLQRRSKK